METTQTWFGQWKEHTQFERLSASELLLALEGPNA